MITMADVNGKKESDLKISTIIKFFLDSTITNNNFPLITSIIVVYHK